MLSQPHASAAAFVLNDKFTTGVLKGPLDSPDGILAKLAAEAEMAPNYIRWFEDIGAGDVASVGGKNASLGEMVRNLGAAASRCPLASPSPPRATGTSSRQMASSR